MVREATLRRRERESREEVKRASSTRRKALASTLSRMRVNGEPPQTWEQYSKHGRMSPTYSWRSSDEEKKLRHLKRTPNFLKADFAMDVFPPRQVSTNIGINYLNHLNSPWFN